MHIFLTISEGESGVDAEPLFATSDPLIVQSVISALQRRIRAVQQPIQLQQVHRFEKPARPDGEKPIAESRADARDPPRRPP